MKLRAFVERLLAPGYSTCGRCRRPWKFVEPHHTTYEVGEGYERACFPLCEACWQMLGTADARAPYYAQMFAAWRSEWNAPRETWEAIRAAVIAESEGHGVAGVASVGGGRLAARWLSEPTERQDP